MFETSGPIFFERQGPLETNGFKRALVFRKSVNEKRVDVGVGLFIAWLSLPSRGGVGRGVGSQLSRSVARPDEAATAVGLCVGWRPQEEEQRA